MEQGAVGLSNGSSYYPGPWSTTEELVRFRQLEERGYWLQAALPNGQELPAPGILARLTETPLTVRRWAVLQT